MESMGGGNVEPATLQRCLLQTSAENGPVVGTEVKSRLSFS